MNFWQLSSIQPRSALVTSTTVPCSLAIRSVSEATAATSASCSRCHAFSSEPSSSLRPWHCTHVEGITVSSQSKMRTVSSVANLASAASEGLSPSESHRLPPPPPSSCGIPTSIGAKPGGTGTDSEISSSSSSLPSPPPSSARPTTGAAVIGGGGPGCGGHTGPPPGSVTTPKCEGRFVSGLRIHSPTFTQWPSTSSSIAIVPTLGGDGMRMAQLMTLGQKT
mmetsp:Transcript_44847/g.126859  ORF Transcript_44847/g.126859 Transcript_44847/m.126859 type:complete len:222 (-) Transcript_44847:7-672(-)